jgi:TatD DNase family protein
MIFESHAHYDDERFNTDRDKVLQSLPNKKIEYVLNVGADLESSKASVALSEQYDFIYAAVGVHPHDSDGMNEAIIGSISKLTEHRKVVAIGEIGLDYYYDNSSPTIQQLWFERQIELAKEKTLPIIVHSRDAAKDTVDIMKATNAEKVGGVIHCFSYSLEMAKLFVGMGYYLGIGGVVTFKNSKKLKEVVEQIPLEHLLIETDCPYLAPSPHRGDRNDSSYLPYVIETIAKLKKVDEEKVMEVTKQNAKKLFRI